MGHDLHITRAELWTESERAPISQAEWQAFVDNRDNVGPVGSKVVLRLPEGTEILMWWWEGQITVNKPFRRDDAYNDLVTLALARFAADANAVLQGDDGENYGTHAEDRMAQPADTSD